METAIVHACHLLERYQDTLLNVIDAELWPVTQAGCQEAAVKEQSMIPIPLGAV